MTHTLLTIVQIIASIGLISLVLLQQGKGADAGASFGGGSASQTFFGSSGSGNFLTRTTAIFALIFFVASLALAWNAKHASDGLEFLNNKGEPITGSEQKSKNMGDLPTLEESSKQSSEKSALPKFEEKSQPGLKELNTQNDSEKMNLEKQTIDAKPADDAPATSVETPHEPATDTSKKSE